MPKRKRTPRTDTSKVIAWNSHNGNGRPQAAAWIATRLLHKHGAQAAVLNEARRLVPFLRAWAKRTGGTVLTEPSPFWKRGDEEGSTVIILAPGVRPARWWTAVQSFRWVVRSTGVWHKPRRQQRVRLAEQALQALSGEHWPPGGPQSVNGAAWRGCLASAERFLTRRRGCRAVIGDLNGQRVDLAPLAARTDADVAGHNVDLAVVVGGNVRAQVLPKYGSDHHAVLYVITPKGA